MINTGLLWQAKSMINVQITNIKRKESKLISIQKISTQREYKRDIRLWEIINEQYKQQAQWITLLKLDWDEKWWALKNEEIKIKSYIKNFFRQKHKYYKLNNMILTNNVLINVLIINSDI